MSTLEFIKCNDCSNEENVEHIKKYIKEKHPWMSDNIEMNISECPRCGSNNIRRIISTHIKIDEDKLKNIFAEILNDSERKHKTLEDIKSVLLYHFPNVTYLKGFWGMYNGDLKIFTNYISFQVNKSYSEKKKEKINFKLKYDEIKKFKIDYSDLKIYTADSKYKFEKCKFLTRIRRPQKRISELTDQEKTNIITEYNNINDIAKSALTIGIKNYYNQKDGNSLRETMQGIKSGYVDITATICEKYNITEDTLNAIIENQ